MRSRLPWRNESLGAALESIDAGWSPACIEQAPSTGQWGILKVSAVTSGRFKREEAKTLPETLSPRHEITVKRSDVVMARANGVAALVGMTAQVRQDIERLMLSDKLLRLNPNPQLLTRDYLALLMLSSAVRAQLDRVLSGSSGQRNISQAQVRALRIQLPPLAEQVRIAEVLDALDGTIDKTEQLIAKLKQVKQGLLHDLLTRGIDDNGEIRDPARDPEQFQDSAVGRIPVGWNLLALENCVRPDASITYGIVQAGPHVPDGIPYIRTGDMSSGKLVLEGLLRTSPRIAANYGRSRVQAGEIVCAIRATVGNVLPVPVELDGANLTQGTARIAPRTEINSIFLLWVLRGHAVQRQFDLSVKGTTFREITLARLRRILVPVPADRAEQDRIASAMTCIEHRERCEDAELAKLRVLKQGLMEDLLTGRVRVTNLLGEAAA